MDAYLESYVNAEYKGIIEELFNYEHANKCITAQKATSTIIPLRGFGRYKPSPRFAEDHATSNFCYKEYGALKGLGRKQAFYEVLSQWFIQNKSESSKKERKSYSYWRGLRSFSFE